ncbi:SpoIIE family protein phosphatase [Streptomyces sp. NPDC004749]
MNERERPRGRRAPAPAPSGRVNARISIDAAGVVTAWNEGAERLLGHPADEAVGRPATAFLAEGASCDLPRDTPPGTPWSGWTDLRHRDGAPVRARLVVHHRAAESGAAADWLVCAALEGTDRAPGDARLEQWAYGQSPCAVAVYDLDGRLRSANREMERVIGLAEDEVRGLRLSEIGGKRKSRELEEQLDRALADGDRRGVRTFMRTGGEANEHDWSVRFAPLRDGDGEVHGVCLAAFDITEQALARRRLLLVNDASVRIGTTLDVTRTAEELAEVCVPHLADFVSVDLLEPVAQGAEAPVGPIDGTVPLCRVAHRSRREGAPEAQVAVGAIRSYGAFAPQAACLASGRPVVHRHTDPEVRRWAEHEPEQHRRAAEFGFRSIMAVPLGARGGTLGVVVFSRFGRPDPFVPDDVLLAEEITARAAVCIDNARRFTHERDTAIALQRSLLPHGAVRPSAVDVAHRYLPASPEAGVGGDWFDVIPLSGARVALVVGDVVGHGVQASATMGRLRTAVRTLADVDLPPDELLTHLDDLVIRLSSEQHTDSPVQESGATCLYAVYDPVSRHCTMASAGHPPPVVVGPDRAPLAIDLVAGPPLGVGGLPFETTVCVLPEGSTLALYTDGLVESRERDFEEGHRLLRETATRPTGSLEELADTLVRALVPDEGASDDAALLLARTQVLDPARTATWSVTADPAQVAELRHEVLAQLSAWNLQEASFVTELVTSELVTNAIRHAAPPIELRLIVDRTLICEVSDSSATAPHLRRAKSFDEGGRGLLLVAQVADRWGSRPTPAGKIIWAEQNLAAPR